VEGAAVVTAVEECLCLHVDIGGVSGEGGNFIGKEDGGGIEVFANAVAHHTSELLNFFLPHLRTHFALLLTVRVSVLLSLLPLFCRFVLKSPN